MQKIVETRSSLSDTIRYTSTIMSNPFCLSICWEGLCMIVLVVLITKLVSLSTVVLITKYGST